MAKDLIFETACRQRTDSLHVVQIHPTLHCNLKCRHCYSSSGPELRRYLNVIQVGDFLEYAKSYGFNVMSVSGGEPFIYPDLEQLLQISRLYGYRNMSASNAMLLKSERAKRCLGNLDLVAVSIDGDEEFHDEIRNQTGAFRKMTEGIKVLKQRDNLFGFIHTITAASWEKLLWLAEFAYDQGAKLLQLHPLELTGRAILEFNHLKPTQETLHKVYIISAYLNQKYFGKMHIHMDFFHRDVVLNSPESISWFGKDFEITQENFAGVLRSIIVDHEGNVFPLSYGFSEHFRIGNINEIKQGKDIFKEFINERGKALYKLFEQVYINIADDTETDMVTWTEMMVKQSNKKELAGMLV